MQRTSGPTTRSKPRLRSVRLWASFACCAAVAGCATSPVIVSDCPAPNMDEQDDLETFLNWEPDRPAAVYMARVLGHLYGLELEEVRGEPER